MNAETILDRIMVKLGMAEEPKAVELAQVKTEDGQAIFEADTFAVGEAVFIVTEDGKIAAPAGEFALKMVTSSKLMKTEQSLKSLRKKPRLKKKKSLRKLKPKTIS